MFAASRRTLASPPSDVNIDLKFRIAQALTRLRAACLGKQFPSVEVAQELSLGVHQLPWRQGAADVLEGLLLGRAAEQDVPIQTPPLAQDAPQVARHLERKQSYFNHFLFEHSSRPRLFSIISIFRLLGSV